MKKVNFILSDGPNFVWKKGTTVKVKNEFFKLIDSLGIEYNLVPANPYNSEYNFAFSFEEINQVMSWFRNLLIENGWSDSDYLNLQAEKNSLSERNYGQKIKELGIDNPCKKFVSDLVYHIYLNKERRFLKDFYFFTVTEEDNYNLELYQL